jgi:3-oxoisoapionate decarboxylase
MRLGISSYTYGWAVSEGRMTARHLLDRAAEFGVGVVQIADNLPAESYAAGSVEAIAAAARAVGVQVEVGTRGCHPDHLRRFIEIAHRFGSPVLRVVVDAFDEHPSLSQVEERIAAVLPHCAAAGVVIAIENHDRFRVLELASLIRCLDSPHVGICLDVVNSFGALEGPHVVVETLGPLTVNLHVKDFAVRRFPHLQGFTIEGRPAGQGMLDIPWLLTRLSQFGRDRCSAITELWLCPDADLEATIAREEQWAKESVRSLRQWIPD